MPSAILSDRARFLVSGPDARPFIQNLVTTDIDALTVGEARAGALLSPQGKILFDFLVSPAGDDLLFDCRTGIASEFVRRLMMYRLRAKVLISEPEQGFVRVSWEEEFTRSIAKVRDTRFLERGDVFREFITADAPADSGNWDALRVSGGVAESGRDFELGDVFPHDVLLDQNGGVGFSKGCFVGQEVVSRMKHRGTARRRVLILRGVEPLPASGTEVTAASKTLGILGTVAGSAALAILRVDRVAEAFAAKVPLMAGGVEVRPELPPGVTFAFPPVEDSSAVPG